MAPPPPGLFSTTAVCLRLSCNPLAISRATTSLEPPGVNGTMMRMVLFGKPCALADEMKASPITQAAKRFTMLAPVSSLAAHDPGCGSFGLNCARDQLAPGPARCPGWLSG